MTPSALPSRRFRSVQGLIGVTLVVLVAMVVAEAVGMFDLAGRVEADAQEGARAAAMVAASELATSEAPRYLATLREDGWSVGVFRDAIVLRQSGEIGPVRPVFWPWSSREEWESSGRPVAGPLPLGAHQVVIAYQPLSDGRVVRIVRRLPVATAITRWRLTGALLGLVVATGGGLLAWLLITRALAPYRELLVEAARVSGGPGDVAEDRYLVQTFRATVQRLESSEAALQRRADELTVLTDVLSRGSTAGVAILGPEGRITACNAVATALLGAGLAPGSALPDAVPTGQGRFSLGAATVELRRLPLLGPAGEHLGEVLFLTDRTGIESLERALAEREQMAQLGELAAGMAHELRNALTTIRGYLRLLADAGPEKRALHLGAIDEESTALGGLLDRFLRFAQPSDLQMSHVDVLTLVSEAVTRVETAYPKAEIELAGIPAPALADPVALASVVENLLRNAVEAARRNVRVTVSTTAGGEIEVAVEDDGPGVAPEIRDRLFRPFVSTKPSGGLGLALARRLTRLHGGEVTLVPGPGGGARFVVRLPAGAP